MFFSSDGIAGFGAYDIFKADGELKKWMPPENLAFPINSSVDDIYYTYGEDASKGFFVSNRKRNIVDAEKTCCYDIFAYEKVDYKHIAMKGVIEETEINITENNVVTEKKKPLENVVVSLYKENPIDEKLIFIKKDTTNDKGEYNFKIEEDADYKIIAEKNDFIQNSYSVTTKEVEKSDTFYTDFGLVKKEVKPIRIKNIYYNTGEFELAEKYKIIIDTTMLKLLQKHPNIIVEISSHTDNVGSSKTNLILSKKRAKGVVDYLIKKGIEKNRVQSIGYGEDFPIVENNTLENRAKNRRTELKIIGTINKDTKIIYE